MQADPFIQAVPFIMWAALLCAAVLIFYVSGKVERQVRTFDAMKQALIAEYDAKDEEHNKLREEYIKDLRAVATALEDAQRRHKSELYQVERQRAEWQTKAEQMERQWDSQRRLNIEAREQLAWINNQMVTPYAVLVREIGEDSFFDHMPAKPMSVTHLNAQKLPEMDYVELYVKPIPFGAAVNKSDIGEGVGYAYIR